MTRADFGSHLVSKSKNLVSEKCKTKRPPNTSIDLTISSFKVENSIGKALNHATYDSMHNSKPELNPIYNGLGA